MNFVAMSFWTDASSTAKELGSWKIAERLVDRVHLVLG